jgi:putative membrane protein
VDRGLVVLAAAAFTGIAHVLRVAANVVGSAAALVLLMLQLTSSAGIYARQRTWTLRRLHPALEN